MKKCEGKQELGNQPLLLLVKKQQAITLYDGNQVEAAKEKFDELMSLQRMEYGGSSVIVAEVYINPAPMLYSSVEPQQSVRKCCHQLIKGHRASIAQVPSNLFIIVHLNFPTSPTKGSYLVNSQIQHASPQSKTTAMGVSATSCS